MPASMPRSRAAWASAAALPQSKSMPGACLQGKGGWGVAEQPRVEMRVPPDGQTVFRSKRCLAKQPHSAQQQAHLDVEGEL